ncbi:MAG: GerW family sporulation protein [Oscillospiraceae bacterium]|nr:GerW family sporulation protein [Oscillospiraceae bacterium]
MSQGNVEGLLNVTLEKLKALVDVNTIIGDPITTQDGTTIVPVSQVSFGFGSGGADLPTKAQQSQFGGGSGGGVTIKPLAFLVIQGENIRMIQMQKFDNSTDRMVNMVPDVIDKFSGLFSKLGKKEDKAAAPADETAGE